MIDIVLFLFFINLGIGVASYSLALYGANTETGISPEEIKSGEWIGGEAPSLDFGITEISIPKPFADSSAFMWAVVGGIIGAAAVPMVGGNVMRAIPIAIFSVVFWWLWGGTQGILNNLYLPSWFTMTITIIYAGVFMLGMFQWATGQSTRSFE